MLGAWLLSGEVVCANSATCSVRDCCQVKLSVLTVLHARCVTVVRWSCVLANRATCSARDCCQVKLSVPTGLHGRCVTVVRWSCVRANSATCSVCDCCQVKLSVLSYMLGLCQSMDPAELTNTSDTRLAVTRIITWTTDPNSVDIRKVGAPQQCRHTQGSRHALLLNNTENVPLICGPWSTPSAAIASDGLKKLLCIDALKGHRQNALLRRKIVVFVVALTAALIRKYVTTTTTATTI